MIRFLIFSILLLSCECLSDTFHEKLLIKPLPSGNVYTVFRFIVEKDIGNDYDNACKGITVIFALFLLTYSAYV